jgi:2-oxoisovalerate dehydrogenase E1 component
LTKNINLEANEKLFKEAVKIRVFENTLLEYFSKGKIRGTVHTCIGQELTPVLIAQKLHENDKVFGTHRGHGYYLSLTNDYLGLAREILGKTGGTSNGIGGSQHLLAANIITNGIQGGLVPVGVGFATSNLTGISVVVIGDGSLGQGVIYESLNIAKLQDSRTLILIEDNRISQTTPQTQTLSGDIEGRARAFGVDYYYADSNDLLNLKTQISSSIDFVRTSNKPALLHISTTRLGPHSKGDDNRPQRYVQDLKQNDLLNQAIINSKILENFWDDTVLNYRELFERLLIEPSAEATTNPHLHRAFLNNSDLVNQVNSEDPSTIRKQINNSIKFALRNTKTLMIGEDIESLPPGMEKPYSGAFGVSENISLDFPKQVKNFPISEQGIAGFAIGRALAGEPTIAEIMFGDFSTLIIDQIRQQASKFVNIYGSQLKLPLIFRIPMGGRRGYGPTHSQNFENLFLGIPNVILFAVSPFGVGPKLLENLLNSGFPTILIESKDLYNKIQLNNVCEPYDLFFPSKNLEPISIIAKNYEPAATIVTYGNAAELVNSTLRKLARESELFFDVFVYEFISPFSIEKVQESLTKTKRLILIEEMLSEVGLASTIACKLSDNDFKTPIQIKTIGGSGDIGASEKSETSALINEELIFSEIRKFIGGA